MKISSIYHSNVHTIHPDDTIADAMHLIHDKHYNGLIVIDTNDKVVGVLSVQDIAGAIVPPEFKNNVGMASAMYKPDFFTERCREIKTKKVRQLMRKTFIHVTLESHIMEVCADFLKNDLYIVPVFNEKDEVVGIITRSQIKKVINECMKD